jgi:hypothetical protein
MRSASHHRREETGRGVVGFPLIETEEKALSGHLHICVCCFGSRGDHLWRCSWPDVLGGHRQRRRGDVDSLEARHHKGRPGASTEGVGQPVFVGAGLPTGCPNLAADDACQRRSRLSRRAVLERRAVEAGGWRADPPRTIRRRPKYRRRQHRGNEGAPSPRPSQVQAALAEPFTMPGRRCQQGRAGPSAATSRGGGAVARLP